MDRDAVLAAFDEQVRRHPEPGTGIVVERGVATTRVIASPDGWSGVTWSDLGGTDVDAAGVDALVRVHDQAFGGDHSAMGRSILTDLGDRPGAGEAFVAYAGATPVSSGRVSFHVGTDFASLWGGGTVRAWRGRGVFRALVSHRAARAAAAGFRYLQVDASADSRPILRRLGFVEVAETTPYTLPPDLG
ncbi:MAG: hypothetical protein ABIW80_14530 [Lapillicoccus sp.]